MAARCITLLTQRWVVAAPQTRTAEAAVFKLANSVSQLKRLVDQLGTQRDTQELRHKVCRQ